MENSRKMLTSLLPLLLHYLFGILVYSGAEDTGSLDQPGLSSVGGLTLTSESPDFVPGLSQHTSINCTMSMADHSTSALSLASLVILKWDPNLQKFRELALISSFRPDDVTTFNISGTDVSGHVDPIGLSYLALEWAYPQTSVAGNYTCESNMLTMYGHNEQATVGIKLQASRNQSGLIDVVESLQTDMGNLATTLSNQKAEIRTLKERIANQTDRDQEQEHTLTELESRVSVLDAFVRGQLQDTVGNLTSKMKSLEKHTDELSQEMLTGFHMEEDFHRLLAQSLSQSWPQGTYGLPETQYGCPGGDFTTWNHGEVTQYTALGTNNQDYVSSPNHLQQPVLSVKDDQHIVTQHFCMKLSSFGKPWPWGSYCINKRGDCPPGFENGSIAWNGVAESFSQGELPDGPRSESTLKFLNTIRIEYCCRSDWYPSVHVALPTSHSFFLYRFGGRCQQVSGMDMSEESIRFDTKDGPGNHDYYEGSHPDGSLKNSIIELQLCYYNPTP